MSMHPSDEIRGVKSKRLSKKKIILGVTGSIAAVESIRLSRELIRHGAEVIPVMTQGSTKIIHPDALEFATGNKPVVELTGYAEHVVFCGRVKKPADLLLISPCTANTISKITYGIDDTPVTTFATTAIGSNIPVLIVPAMHISMYNHKTVQENIQKCKKNGIKFVDPYLAGSKAKMANIDEIVSFVFRETGRRDLHGEKILIIGGSTAEPVDDVRVIANRSSGKTAVWLAKNAFYRGADVELWYGLNQEPSPSFIKTVNFESIKDITKLLKNNNLKKFDSIIVCAAIADYVPKKKTGKIPSDMTRLVLELKPASKIISELRKKAPDAKIIGFKVEEKKEKIEEKAFKLLKKNNLDFVIANTVSGFDKEKNEIWIIDKKRKTRFRKGKKEHLADHILNVLKEK